MTSLSPCDGTSRIDGRERTRIVTTVAAAALWLAASGTQSARAQSTGDGPVPSSSRYPASGARARSTRHIAPWIVWPPAAESCSPAIGDAKGLLVQSRAAIGLDAIGPKLVRRVSARLIEFHNYESDRPYRPFITFATDHQSTLDPTTGVERDSSVFAFAGFGDSPPAVTVRLSDDRAVFVRRDTAWARADGAWRNTEAARALDPWVVVQEWAAASDVHVSARCRYRDYPRTVLERTGIFGAERLYIDAKTGFPVKLDREEPHYLWGQQHVEYVYMSWLRFGGTLMPVTSAKLIDGDEEIVRHVSDARGIPRDSAPALTMPDTAVRSAIVTPGFLRPTPIDTLRLGPRTFALRNPGYTELVTLSRDTVFVLDATQGEERARSDSAWVGRLFPGRHPIVVLVTDLAWPHVAGLRFWVASGATIVSRDLSEPFLRSVIERRWTAAPDRLERERARVALRFIPVRDSVRLGGISVHAIDGIASEGALMAYLPADRLLWASDYVQSTSSPTLYASEVYAAACRAGLAPTRGAAEHVPPFDWSTIATLAQQLPLAGASAPGTACRSATP